MEITLNRKKYKLHFGINFIKELDQKYSTEAINIKYGTGVNTIYSKLDSPNPYPLFEAIHAALYGQIDLTEEDFDDWVDSLPNDEALVKYIDKVKKELETSRQTKFLVAAYQENLKQFLNDVNKQFNTNPTEGDKNE